MLMKMRRILSLALAFFLLVPLVSCAQSSTLSATDPVEIVSGTAETGGGTKTADSKELPSYALRENASPDQLRAMAVKAMRDMLTVKWTPSQAFKYYKMSGTAQDMSINFEKGKLYAGLPYTAAGTSLFHFFEYYDPKTGVLNAKTFQSGSLDEILGNSAASCIFWSWSSVCASVSGQSTSSFVYANGCLPVGPYTYDFSINAFAEGNTTLQICEDNGQELMYQSYAEVKPADGLVFVNFYEGHAAMAVDEAHVVKDAAGKINGEESYILIQEQVFQGLEAPTVSAEDPNAATFGSLDKKMTFSALFEKKYLPVTTAEFLGQASYQKPAVTYVPIESGETRAAVGAGRLQSSFQIISVTVLVTGQDGKEAVNRKKVLDREAIRDGSGLDYDLSAMRLEDFLKRKLAEGQSYRYEVKVLTATGETFTPVAFDFTA